MTNEAKKPYLSICAVYRDEARYLREWVAFHRLVGVERFILYNHASVDEHREALAPFVDAGVVEIHDWPDVLAPQHGIYDHVLKERRDDSRWIAFIDLDEFLFSPTGLPVSEVLREYEEWPGVAVNWVVYGTSGHRTRPEGLVIENYLHRANSTTELTNKRFKCVVDPFRTSHCEDCHHFSYREVSHVVDENMRQVETPATDMPSFSRLRINHYWTKSQEDLDRKFSRPRASDGARLDMPPMNLLDPHLSAERDETILRYLPAVRAELERLESGLPATNGQLDAGLGPPLRSEPRAREQSR